MLGRLLALVILFSSSSVGAQYDVILSEFKTEYTAWGKNRDRAHNISLAAIAINGVVVMPDETFSFNAATGRRSIKNGYREAKVIEKGDLIDAPGGGVCQVSSTLHAAVLHAGLHIVEHSIHSRASAYIGPGLDATVNWGTLDFKFINNTRYPIRIEAVKDVVRLRGTLTVRLWSERKTFTSDIDIDIHRKKLFDTLTYPTRALKTGEVIIVDPGTNGYVLTRTQTITDLSTGMIFTVRKRFVYRSTPRILYVGE